MAAFVLLAATFALGAAMAWAAEEHGPDWKRVEIPRIVNFVVIFVLLYLVMRKPVSRYFLRRREQIAEELREAQAARDAAEQKLREYERRIANLEQEKQQIEREAEEERRRMQEGMGRDVEAAVARIEQQARESIAQERRKALRDLRAEAAALAVELAEGLLRENLGPDDQQRLLDRYLEDLERDGRN